MGQKTTDTCSTSAGLPGECGINTNRWTSWGKTSLLFVCHVVGLLSIGYLSSDKTIKSSVNSCGFLKTDPELMGIHFIHGATTFKEVSIEEPAGGAGSEGSFLLEFPDTIASTEGFAEYLREKKGERHLWRLGRVGCMSVHWSSCSPLRAWLWWKTGSHRLDLPFFQKEPQEEPWMKFDDASKWQEANLTVTECATVFSSPSRDGLKSLLYHLP